MRTLDLDRDDVAAERWLASALENKDVRSIVVFIGAGNGQVLEALDRRAPNAKILVLEPDPTRARGFLAAGKWADRIAAGRLAYLADPDYDGANEAWRVFPTKEEAPVILVHPSAAAASGTARAKEALKRILFGVRANAQARKQFAPRYLLNSIRNIPAIVAGRDVRALTDAYKGMPAIVAGAGPSLDHAIPKLQELQGRALLIACDTALRPLLHAGIAPQLVVGLDPSAANARHFLELPDCKDTWLVAESALDRNATSVFDGRTFWFRVANHQPWPWLNEQGIDVGKIDVWGSVLTGAFQVACLAGCDPIVFVGADLAYTDYRPYARGTTYEFDWAHYAAIGQTMFDTWRGHVWNSTVERVPDVLGGSTITTNPLMAFRDWIVARAKHSGRRIVNATGAGILGGDGIEQGRLDITANDVRELVPVADPSTKSWSDDRAAALATQLRDLGAIVKTNGATRPPLVEWVEFAGGTLDTAAIGDALERVVCELEAPSPSRPTVMRVSPTSQIAEASAGILTRIPEALLRLGAGLQGVTPLPDVNDAHVDRSRALLHAFGLLVRVANAAGERDTDLTLVRREMPVSSTPVSGLYNWAEPTKWAVEIAEALLGLVWITPATPPVDFFTRPIMVRDGVGDEAPNTLAMPHINNAGAMLTMEWLRCAVDAQWTQGAELGRVLFDAAMAQSKDVTSDAAPSPARPVTSGSIRVALPRTKLDFEVPGDERSLARVLTGTLRTSPDDEHILPIGDTGCELRIGGRRESARGPGITLASRRPFVAPVVLTDHDVPRAAVVYAHAEGAIAVTLHEGDTIVIRENGSIAPYHRWPRPAMTELRFGGHGAVAWGDGLAGWPEVRPGYVMYREDPGGDVQVQDLPIRPTAGVWWRGRLYWSCFPRRVASWTGIASWAPGEDVKLELPGFPSTLGMHAPDAGLVLEEGGRPNANGGWDRRLTRNGWTWVPGADPVPFQLDRFGAVSARAARGQWTAIAYPEADVIRLESTDGRAIWLTCYYPYTLSWVGRSLLVGTIQRELLLFRDLEAMLEA